MYGKYYGGNITMLCDRYVTLSKTAFGRLK